MSQGQILAVFTGATLNHLDVIVKAVGAAGGLQAGDGKATLKFKKITVASM